MTDQTQDLTAGDEVSAPVPPAPKLTVSTLTDKGINPGAVASPKWQAAQYVEPERDGQPWCTAEDAEEMLVLAALPQLNGMAAKEFTKYALTTAGSVMTLKLG